MSKLWKCLPLLLGIASPALANETLTYTYDVHGRLKQIGHGGSVNNGVQSSYSYDAVDNRTNLTVSGTGRTGSAAGNANLSGSATQSSAPAAQKASTTAPR